MGMTATQGIRSAPAPYWLMPGGAAAPGAAQGPAPGHTRPIDHEPHVLLVEDNLINQVVAMEFLSLMGIKATLASNGVEALDACRSEAPDLVLMDIQMPCMDGLECARRMRAQQREGKLAPFPILALTAHALDADVSASMEAGMDEHLTKPLDFTALRRHLQRWLNLPGAH
jgi:CheY-like chemotaxis protein